MYDSDLLLYANVIVCNSIEICVIFSSERNQTLDSMGAFQLQHRASETSDSGDTSYVFLCLDWTIIPAISSIEINIDVKERVHVFWVK